MGVGRERASRPEDLARLFAERATAGDADGIAELYESDAVLAFPPGQVTTGRAAIKAVMEEMLRHVSKFEVEEPMPTVRVGDLALTSTVPKDNTGGRVQVVRRQPDGSWLRLIDRPEVPEAAR